VKVLHIQRVSGIGGSERHLLTLLPALIARGVDARMCVLATADAHRFIEPLAASGVPVTTIPAGPDVNPVAVARLVRRIRAERPDVVHTHLIHGDTHGQAAARLCSVVGVSSFHGCHPFYERLPYGAVSRLAWRSPRVTIAISEHLRRYLVDRALAPADRVRVIHYGMDVAGWRFSEGDRSRERARLELGPDDVAVAVSSRLVPEKGHADLIDAMAIAIATRGDDRLRLLVAGDGPLRASLEAQAASVLPPGSYRFLGFVDDIRAFMNGADVFAFPTTPDFGEGFGLAALEASAVGLPIVATSVGPIPEVVADGESGRLVPPRDPAALARVIVELAGDSALRRRLGEGAARRARDVFGLDRMVERTIEVYDEVGLVLQAGSTRYSGPPKESA
jgi:glycosyltransferase involved in cell wall biosynthesis